MSPVATVRVPRFGPQTGSGQRDEPPPDRTRDRTRDRTEPGNNPGNARGEETRLALKVKLPKLKKRPLSMKATREDDTPGRWTPRPAAGPGPGPTRTAGGTCGGAGTQSDCAGGDVFFFSQRPSSKARHGKDKAKLAVLRTISKMLGENQLIRRRLVTLSQAN